MKRLLLLLVVLSLTGVGFLMAGGQQEEATDEETDGKTKIVYWQYFYETKKETVDTLIERFEEENPNVEVVHQTFPYENYNTKVASAVPAGEGPNVINLYYGWMPVYLGSEYLQPLPEEYFDTAEIEDEFFDMISAVKKDGSYYALPTAVRSLALFYNKGLFEEAGLDPNAPPQTLDELVEYGKKLTKRDDNGNLLQEGMTMMLRGQLHHWLREGLIRQFGGQPYSEDNTEVMYDGEAGYDAFEFYVDLNREHELGEPQFMTDDVTAFKTGNAGL